MARNGARMNLLRVILLVAASLSALQAKIVTEVVPYTHDGVELEGFLAYDDTLTNPVPGVLIVHEWWGHEEYVRERARKVAELGYVAFALDMYGKGVQTTDPKKAGELAGQFYGKPLTAKRAQAGLDQLLKHARVDKDRVASIGYCFGGMVSQELAYSGAPLDGIVSFHGSLVPATAATAKANKAKFLICNGAADPFVKAEEIEKFITSINEQKIDCQFINYSGAIHAFTNPRADQVAKVAGLQGIGYNAAADKRSWEAMQVFFKEAFSAR